MHLNNLSLQCGASVLSIIIILLLALSFTIGSASKSITDFARIDQHMTSHEKTLLDHKVAVRKLALTLRVKDLDALEAHDLEQHLTVSVTDFLGEKQQAVAEIAISSSSHGGKHGYKEHFLRYPSLLNIPAASITMPQNSDVLEYLFNRSTKNLYSDYFPAPLIASDCHTLQKANIYWVTGDCLLDAETVEHSSKERPILFIVTNGNLTLKGNTRLFGLVLLISANKQKLTLSIEKNASVLGGIVSNADMLIDKQGLVQYSSEVLINLQRRRELQKIIPILGSAHEF